MSVSRELRAEIRERRNPPAMVDGKQVPGSIPFLRQLLATKSDPYERDALLGELAGEYLRADLQDEHLLVQRERVDQHPDEPVMWLGLAHSLSMRMEGVNEAKAATMHAIELSRRMGKLVRYSLRCQAELARTVNDSTLFEKSLEELIADARSQREDDVSLDDQLVADLPQGFCAPEVIARYRAAITPS